jgi:putative tricarboxylic transport membrane protein
MRRSLAISQGDWSVFLTQSVSAVLLIAAMVLVLLPLVLGLRRPALADGEG